MRTQRVPDPARSEPAQGPHERREDEKHDEHEKWKHKEHQRGDSHKDRSSSDPLSVARVPGAASPLGEIDQQHRHAGAVTMAYAKAVREPMKLSDGVTVRHLINGGFELDPADLFEAERLTQ